MQSNNSKLNAAALCIIVFLIVLGIVSMKKKDTDIPLVPSEQAIIQQDNINSDQSARNTFNDEGFSLNLPSNFIAKTTTPRGNDPETESKITYSDNRPSTESGIYFGGATPGYSVEKGLDVCTGSVNYSEALASFGESINSKGSKYVYHKTTDEITPDPLQFAIFKLNKGKFPTVAFCTRDMNMSESEFKSFIDTVEIK
jgi:hypothetical protein